MSNMFWTRKLLFSIGSKKTKKQNKTKPLAFPNSKQHHNSFE